MIRRFSIRVILTAWFTAMLALIVCALGVAMYFAMRHTITRAADNDLSSRLEEIGPFIEAACSTGICIAWRTNSRHIYLASDPGATFCK